MTLFPESFNLFKNLGVVGSALRGERGQNKISLIDVNIRDYAPNKWKKVDDAPYGGGAGMVLRPDVLAEAFNQAILSQYESRDELHVVYLSPRGQTWNQKLCQKMASWLRNENGKDFVFICGRYEGVDERFLEHYVDEHISLGDFILSGGEIAAMAIIDSLCRLIPGVLGNQETTREESFEDDLLEYPQYTRPPVFEGKSVPEVLLSGHHQKIQEYRDSERQRLTKKYRPDLLEKKSE